MPCLADGTPDCATLAAGFENSSTATKSAYDGINSADLSSIDISGLPDDTQSALRKFAEARSQLLPVLRAYLNSIQDAAYALQKCARD